MRGALHRRDVGIDEDDVFRFLLERFDRLAAAVVELSSLSDAESATAEQKHAADGLAHCRSVGNSRDAAAMIDDRMFEKKLKRRRRNEDLYTVKEW